MVLNINNEFYWNILQSLEKYFKALILTNDESAKDYGHDIEKMFLRAQNIYPGFCFENLEDSGINTIPWHKESGAEFVRRIFDWGSTETKYNLKGYNIIEEDVLKLDQIAYKSQLLFNYIRNDVLECLSSGSDFSTIEFTQVQRYQESTRVHLYSKYIIDLITGEKDDFLKNIFLYLNKPFDPCFEHQVLFRSWHSVSHPLYMHIEIVKSKNSSLEEKEFSISIIKWFIEKIQVSRSHEKELKKIISEISAKGY